MKTWKRWKRTLQLIFNPTTRQIAAAIRLGEAKERNRAKREAQNKPYIWIDPAMRSKGYEQSAWNSPERHTDIPPALKDPKYVEQIRTLHELPRMPHNPLSITRLEPMNSAEWML